MKKIVFFAMILCLFALAACSHEDEKDKNADAKVKTEKVTVQNDLFQDKSGNVKIKETTGWTIDKQLTEGDLPLVLTNTKLKAILSSTETEHTFQEIKNDLKAGSGKIKVIQEKTDFLSYHSLNKESIETDVYLKKGQDKNYVVIFMMPADQADSNQEKIKSLLDNLSIN